MTTDSYDTVSISGSNNGDNVVSSIDSENKLDEHLINPNIKIKGILKYPVQNSDEKIIKRMVKFCTGLIVCILVLVVVVIFFI